VLKPKQTAIALLCILVLPLSSFFLITACANQKSSDSGLNPLGTSATGSGSYFSVSPYYTPGIEPDVAFADDGIVVLVYDSGSGRLQYKVGEVYDPVIFWGNGHDYDNGKEPSVAFADNGIVVEVHRCESTYTLCYHVGEIQKTGDNDVGEITWGLSYKYGNATCNSPAVAVDGTTVVSVHSQSDRLYYRVGTLNAENKTIDWSDSHAYDTGVSPDVAIQGDTVVEVHQSENYNTLWYHVGKMNGTVIDWSDSRQYDTGTHPSVGLLEDGTVVETHTSDNYDTLWSHVGVVDVYKLSITWRNPHRPAKDLGTRHLPTSVAVRHCGPDEPAVVIITILDEPVWKQKSDGGWTVSERRSYLRDELGIIGGSRIQLTEERWMELSPWIYDLPIRDLRLIGSHDAASDGIITSSVRCRGYDAEKFDENPNDHPSDSELEKHRCQSESILEQLRAGVRYFDLRVALQEGEFYSEHIFLAGPFEGEGGILDQINQFLEECPGEVIFLCTDAEHIYSDTTDDGKATLSQRNDYFEMVMENLPGKLALAPEFSDDLNESQKSNASLDKTLRDVLNSRGRIIYIGPSGDELSPGLMEYIWPLQKDGIWHQYASDPEKLYNDYDKNDNGKIDDDEIGLNTEVCSWIAADKEQLDLTDKLHVLQAMTNGGSMGKIDMAAVVNPQVLGWLLSGDWKSAPIPVIQVNDAVNTPDWVRVFLLNWMPKTQ